MDGVAHCVMAHQERERILESGLGDVQTELQDVMETISEIQRTGDEIS